MALPDGLLDWIKSQLQITWTDDATDARTIGIIEDGIAYLDDKLGAAGDYLSPGYPRQNLKEYCRYARDNALDVFENNYQSQILAMQTQRKVADYVVETTE